MEYASAGWTAKSSCLSSREDGRRSWPELEKTGTVSNVCVSTGARSTREYYLERPILHGADDRGGGLALMAAVEVEKLGRALDRE